MRSNPIGLFSFNPKEQDLAFEDMSQEELEDRLEEIEEEIQELEAIEFVQMLEYMEEEGFIEVEDERIYSIGEASCSLPEVPASL